MIDDYPHDYRDEDSEPEGARGLLPDSLRKALVTGISTVFMSEEGIRKQLGDLRLPKEAIAYLIAQTDRTRRDVFGAVTKELKGWLEDVDLSGAMRKALTGMKVEVKAEFRFVEDGTESTVSSRVITGEEDEPPTPRKSKKKKTSRKRTSKRTPKDG